MCLNKLRWDLNLCTLYVLTGNCFGRGQPCVWVMEKTAPSCLHGIFLLQCDQCGCNSSRGQARGQSDWTIHIQVGCKMHQKMHQCTQRCTGCHKGSHMFISWDLLTSKSEASTESDVIICVGSDICWEFLKRLAHGSANWYFSITFEFNLFWLWKQ